MFSLLEIQTHAPILNSIIIHHYIVNNKYLKKLSAIPCTIYHIFAVALPFRKVQVHFQAQQLHTCKNDRVYIQQTWNVILLENKWGK